MLTGYQCEVVAGYTEYGDILCLDCCADEWTKPLIRYSLDEEQNVRTSESLYEDDPENHVEDCECLYSLNCDGCGAELVDEYTDTRCEDKQEGVNDERDSALD